ncbi:uncharacterized protein [Periplaneta americana]|uniref:uncharacterized protein isoform X2 n=1 Tax=Periplaneta americana TaxID=6978 RepID=UPI0037E77F45
MSYYFEEYVDQGYALTNEVKIDKDPMPISLPMVKREPEERNFLDHHVTGIREEYEDQSSDLLSEIKCEKDLLPTSFPMLKLEQEEEQTDSDAVNEDPRVEVTPEDNEVLTERCREGKKWNPEQMKMAVQAVRNGEMGSFKAARIYNVPQTTLERYVKDEMKSPTDVVKTKLGRKQYLPSDLQKDLAEHCILLEER